MKHKSAIIPYRYIDGELQILLIKNSDNTKWVIPKGTIEKPLAPSISATKEAYEEAGVLGIPHPILVGTYYKNNQDVPTYLLEVIIELMNYEEDDKRNRAWHNIKELNEFIVDDDLLSLIKLGSKIIRKNGYYFKYAMQSFCDDMGTNLVKITKKRAIIAHTFDGVSDFKISIKRKKTFLYFSLKSKFIYKSLNEIPKELMSKVMLDNTISKMGYWSLKKVKTGFVFQRMFNEELKVLSSESLHNILKYLIESYISIEELIKDQISLQDLIAETED